MSATLSLAMIVKNEEALLERALACARAVCDELIVVDTGSTDRTVEIATRMGANVFHFDWIDDFAAARNASFDHCTSDWIIYLDADDIIPEASLGHIHSLKQAGFTDTYDMLTTVYEVRFDEAGRPVTFYPRERIVRRSAGLRWHQRIHEYIACEPARTAFVHDITIQHRPDESLRTVKRERNARIIESTIASEGESPALLFYRATMLFDAHRWMEATEAYRHLLDRFPREFYPYDAMVRLAFCASELGDESAALHWANEAYRLDPNRAEALVRMGLYHCARLDWEQAIPYFEQATQKVRPVDPFLFDRDYTWAPWNDLSVCYGNLGRYREAIACAQKALAYGVDVERIRNNIRSYSERL